MFSALWWSIRIVPVILVSLGVWKVLDAYGDRREAKVIARYEKMISDAKAKAEENARRLEAAALEAANQVEALRNEAPPDEVVALCKKDKYGCRSAVQ